MQKRRVKFLFKETQEDYDSEIWPILYVYIFTLEIKYSFKF